MPSADFCYHRIVKGCEKDINKGKTPKRKGTTKNPPVPSQVLPPGAHTCGFCGQTIFIPGSPFYRRPMFNPDIGFVCLDCTKPKPRQELNPPHHYYVEVRWGPFGIFTEKVPRHTLSHYGPCVGRGCTRVVARPGNLCSHVCALNVQLGPGCVENRVVNSNPLSWYERRYPEA